MNNAFRLVIVATGAAIACAAPAQHVTVRDVAREIQAQIGDIHEALGESTPADQNVAEVCFRAGNLYQSARHELEEVDAERADLSPTQKELVEALIKDAKSLTSFCGDREKQQKDPGYEQVPRGDQANLARELARMNDRAARLATAP